MLKSTLVRDGSDMLTQKDGSAELTSDGRIKTGRTDLLTEILVVSNLISKLDWTCGGYSAGAYDGIEDSLKVEALMRIACTTKDAAGLITLFRLPPAVAVAIIEAFKSGDVIGFADRVSAALEAEIENGRRMNDEFIENSRASRQHNS